MIVLKYPIAQGKDFIIEMPREHRVVEIRVVSGVPWMWVEANEASPKADFTFSAVRTGVPVEGKHAGTWEQPVMYHLFEVP